MSFSANTQGTEKTCNVARRSKYHKGSKDQKILLEWEVQDCNCFLSAWHAETRREPLALFVSGAGDDGVQEQGKA